MNLFLSKFRVFDTVVGNDGKVCCIWSKGYGKDGVLNYFITTGGKGFWKAASLVDAEYKLYTPRVNVETKVLY